MELENFKEYTKKKKITKRVINIRTFKNYEANDSRRDYDKEYIEYILSVWRFAARTTAPVFIVAMLYFSTSILGVSSILGFSININFLIILGIILLFIINVPHIFEVQQIYLSDKKVYSYYNKNNKNIFNTELFYSLKFPDVRLNPENTKIYFDGKNITNEILACNTVEKQIKFIQNLRMQI